MSAAEGVRRWRSCFEDHMSDKLLTATLTLAAPKVGLADSDAVGELFVADISVPDVDAPRWS